jgi:hypothetical protein
MSGYELLGNLPTGEILEWAKSQNIYVQVENKKYVNALDKANKILY